MKTRETKISDKPGALDGDTADGRASAAEYPFPASEAEGQLAREARKAAEHDDAGDVPPPTRIGEEPRQMPS